METKQIWEELKKPFPPNDLEWRVQSAGQGGQGVWALVVPYVTNRAIQERLDAVVGPNNWRNKQRPAAEGGQICRLHVRVDGEWNWKEDGAPLVKDHPVKGSISNSMKRAAVHWGIGRYLYKLDAHFARVDKDGEHRGSFKDKKTNDYVHYRWHTPELPEEALPDGFKPAHTQCKKTMSRIGVPDKEIVPLYQGLLKSWANGNPEALLLKLNICVDQGWTYSPENKSIIKPEVQK